MIGIAFSIQCLNAILCLYLRKLVTKITSLTHAYTLTWCAIGYQVIKTTIEIISPLEVF